LATLKTLKDARDKVGLWLACWLAFDCIFGKRRIEICKLEWSDIHITDNHLFVTFHVGKKKSKVGPIDSTGFHKTKILSHYAMPYILEFLKTEKRTSKYLFPAPIKQYPDYCYKKNKETVTIHRTFLNSKGETVEKDQL
jgi:integrase